MESFKASISVTAKKDVQEKIKVLFASEDSTLNNNRASYTIDCQADSLNFLIVADDAVALRAITNAVCKTLSVFEKTSKI